MESKIRWKSSDYAKLRKAVSDFNKKLKNLKNEENKIYMPDFVSYQDIKSDIVSRRELNNTINSLRRFMREGSEELYTTESGEVLTKWERRELSIKTRAITRRLEKELKELNIPDTSGFSRAQMGSGRVKEIKNQLKRYRSLEKLKGFDFKSTIRNIKGEYSMGELKKATIYKENYLKMVRQQFSGYDHFEELVAYIESFSNPIDFWNAVKNNEKFNDITFMYDEITTQNKLNSLLEDIEIID